MFFYSQTLPSTRYIWTNKLPANNLGSFISVVVWQAWIITSPCDGSYITTEDERLKGTSGKVSTASDLHKSNNKKYCMLQRL